MSDNVIDMGAERERRCVRDIMELALENGVPAEDVRLAIAQELANTPTGMDWDRYEAELRRLWENGAVDRADFGLEA